MRGSPRCDKDLMAGPGSGEIIQGVEDWEEQDIAWPRLERPLLRLWWRCCTKLGHESKTSTISIYFEQARSLVAQWLSTLLLSNGKGLGFRVPFAPELSKAVFAEASRTIRTLCMLVSPYECKLLGRNLQTNP